MVRKQIELIRLRNTHPAFSGEFQVDAPSENRIEIQWKLQEHMIKLQVDLSVPSATITGTSPIGEVHYMTISDAVDSNDSF